MVTQPLVGRFQGRILGDVFRRVVDAVNAKPLLLVPNICFRIFNHGKKKKDFCLVALVDVDLGTA